MPHQLISICIPVFNGEPFITETLRSLTRQTYREIEIVVSDNASTDRTVDLVRSAMREDARIRLLTSGRNAGYCRNVAKAVRSAESDVVAIYHADDLYEPTIIQREFDALVTCPGAAAVFTELDTFTGSPDQRSPVPEFRTGSLAGLRDAATGCLLGGMEEFGKIILELGNIFACPSLMTRKALFEGLGGFTDSYPSNEDLDLWIRFLAAGHKLCIVPAPLLHYRRSETHASAYWEKRIASPVEFSVIEERLIPAFGFGEKELGMYRRRKARILVEKAVQAIKSGNLPAARDLLAASRSSARLSPFTKRGLLQLSARLDSLVLDRNP